MLTISVDKLEHYRQLFGDRIMALFIEILQPETPSARKRSIARLFYNTLLIRLKFEIRTQLKNQERLNCHYLHLERKKQKLEAVEGQPSRFLTHQLQKLYQALEETEALQAEYRHQLSRFGALLFNVMGGYDECASLHDKAQMLNIHHSRLERILAQRRQFDDAAEPLCFYELVLSYRLEREQYPPFFEALKAKIADELFYNRQFQDTLLAQFEQRFPHLPKYRVIEDQQGQKTLERQRPQLKVINPDGSSKSIKR